MVWYALALVLGLIFVLLSGPRVMPVLRRLKFGQTIYELGPKSHQVKQGTPTMGGLMFVAGCTVVSLAVSGLANGLSGGFWNFTVGVLIAALLNMLIGFVDDYIKVVKKRNLGLIWWQKIIGQVVFSFLFSLYCYLNPNVGSSIIIPCFHVEWNLGIFYIPVMTCVMIFMANSSNLQDGLDGLLSSVTAVGSGTLGIIALVLALTGGALAKQYQSLAIVAFALSGCVMGFLRFNYYPAKVFMGDTGSMFIGGAVIAMTMLLRMPLIMILVCVTWLASSFSVIIQRIYFKVTHGKRIFKMSPIHHHFELSGMTECQIVAMYTVVEGLACLLSLFAVL